MRERRPPRLLPHSKRSDQDQDFYSATDPIFCLMEKWQKVEEEEIVTETSKTKEHDCVTKEEDGAEETTLRPLNMGGIRLAKNQKLAEK
ncbi:putative 14-3-3-like protein GF14-D [Iris pallida]|uniref:14-3-3-like protein GF14-D n=1 Tax=Iris pallida TaxID=29817 RepID=A0AAX6FA99_IRIPA|nr:putative 14-3-3-like protein GF14-D [Iris pallida]